MVQNSKLPVYNIADNRNRDPDDYMRFAITADGYAILPRDIDPSPECWDNTLIGWALDDPIGPPGYTLDGWCNSVTRRLHERGVLPQSVRDAHETLNRAVEAEVTP